MSREWAKQSEPITQRDAQAIVTLLESILIELKAIRVLLAGSQQ